MIPKPGTLAQMPLFASLTETEVQALGQRAVERRFAPEEMLFWEGEPCAGIFLIIQGSVKIFKTSPGGREMMLALETAPSTVAELPLFDGGPYPASVRAVMRSTWMPATANGDVAGHATLMTFTPSSSSMVADGCSPVGWPAGSTRTTVAIVKSSSSIGSPPRAGSITSGAAGMSPT